VRNAFQAGTTRRQLARTENLLIGAVPEQAQTDDLVCVLYGCSVPVVLRKSGEDSYGFIGDCYIHDFMDGEAIAMAMKGIMDEQEFTLR
jgi:hypothetical protein